MLEANTIINDTYRVIRSIGKGGTGVIYLAEHMHLRKMVVLKRIKGSLDNAKVKQEADMLKLLHHTYLPQVYDCFEYDSGYFTVIDFIDGKDFQFYLENNFVFPEEQLIKIMIQLCDALDYLHNHDTPVYHYDIKPANIILSTSGNICLIDFNISGDSDEMVYGFTAEYASPEQYYKVLSLTGKIPPINVTMGAQSDLYSLGASMYVIASHVPISVYSVINNTQPKLSQLSTNMSDGFCRIIDRLIEKDVSKRYSSAAEVRSELVNLQARQRNYKKYLMLQATTIVISGMIILAGIWMVFSGLLQIRTEKFKDSYDLLCEVYNNGMYVDALDTGMEILSEKEWKSLIDDGRRSKINYIVGMSFYYAGDIPDSDKYMTASISSERSSAARAEYEKEYAVILARQKRFDEARSMIENAINDGLSNEESQLIYLNIEYSKGNYDTIIDNYGQYSSIMTENENISELNELVGDAYSQKGDYENAARSYSNAYSVTGSAVTLRKLASVYVVLSDSSNVESMAFGHLKSAAACFEKLVSDNRHPLAEDMINLGKVYRLMGNKSGNSGYYDSSAEILEKASESFPDDYRIYVQMAFTYYNKGDENTAADRCRQADSLYSGSQSSDRNDVNDMTEFEQLKAQLGV